MKNFEPVIFEDFFIKNWESFKKWKTKGFYTIFTTNEHEWISAIDFKWLIVTHHELSHSKTTRWLVNYERKSFRPNFIIQTIELIWSIWEKPIRPIRYQSTIVPPTTAKVSTWPFFLSRNTVFFLSQIIIDLEWPMDYYIDYLKRLRIGSLVSFISTEKLLKFNYDPTKRNWETEWRTFVLLEGLASCIRLVECNITTYSICSATI